MDEPIDRTGPRPVTVVGIGEDGWDGLSAGAREALSRAPVIVGSARQLALLPDLGVRCERLPAPLLDHLDELVKGNPGLCLLASGDPMLHGIGATLARRLGPGGLTVFPAVSSVALACARLGWPEHEVTVVSLVAQPPEAALAALRPGARVLLLGRDGRTPGAVARLLAAAGWGDSEVTVLERLGGPAERVLAPVPASGLAADPAAAEPTTGEPATGQPATGQPATGQPATGQFADLCVVAVRPRAGAAVLAAGRLPGLPDAAFETDGQITRRELRALALTALRPGPGELLWDVGAGSGSIGIEWLRAEPLARAIAIEARADRGERAQRNAAALGVPGLRLVCGRAPAALAGLPAPDAIFVGGGLTADGMLETCWRRLSAGGRLVAHAVTVESEAVLHRWQRAEGGHLVRLDLSYLEPLGTFTTWRPALPVIQWQVTRGQATGGQATGGQATGGQATGGQVTQS
jgi:precorrin-6B C5,15-methyltransferase / cobalt-precorrin-6B C5,C15-methyltransferase